MTSMLRVSESVLSATASHWGLSPLREADAQASNDAQIPAIGAAGPSSARQRENERQPVWSE